MVVGELNDEDLPVDDGKFDVDGSCEKDPTIGDPVDDGFCEEDPLVEDQGDDVGRFVVEGICEDDPPEDDPVEDGRFVVDGF